jgi:hypothetical protein
MADINQPTYQGQARVAGNEPAMQMTIRQQLEAQFVAAHISSQDRVVNKTTSSTIKVVIEMAKEYADKLIESWQVNP